MSKKIHKWTYEDLKKKLMIVVLHNEDDINDFCRIVDANNTNYKYEPVYTKHLGNWCAAMIDGSNTVRFIGAYGIHIAKEKGFTFVNMRGYVSNEPKKYKTDVPCFYEETMDINIEVRKDETMAHSETTDGRFITHSCAKRTPDDKFNAYIGARIALDRLFGFDPKFEDIEEQMKAKSK